jgi:hypothetical protein
MKYFIFLKTKMGDFNTIKTLNLDVKNLVPVFDLTAKVKNNSSPDILKKQTDFCKNIMEHWDKNKLFYIDHYDIDLKIRHAGGLHPYGHYQQLLQQGFNVGLVTGIDRDSDYNAELINLSSSFKDVKILIRLHIEDISAIRITFPEIIDLYNELKKSSSRVDFAIDNRIITLNDLSFFHSRIMKFIAAVEKQKIDSLIVVTSSSFPASIKDYVATGAVEILPLLELKLWHMLLNEDTNYASLTYGDYGVVSPDFMEIETDNGKGIPIVPKITYTFDNNYVVSRGKKTSTHPRGYKQYKDMAQYFINLPSFRKNYSYGEIYMARISDLTNTQSGNPTTWITACMSQHVNYIYNIID